ncbi:MAG: hypothetical protein KDN19_14110 [Verrucomicrobiae bacterium]|nr:hypothetical protein [Verrucomicrobiae bacterium]
MRGSSKPCRPAIWSALVLWTGVLHVGAQEITSEGEEWHQFQDREGHELEARVLAFSSDWRQVRIERRDGRTFEIEVTRLALDDQQFLRDWLIDPHRLATADLHFELNLTRRDSPGEKRRMANAVEEIEWETSETGYEISVTNLSRQPVVNLSLEYCLLIQEEVEILAAAPIEEVDASAKDGDTDEITRLYRARKTPQTAYLFGSLPLPPLAFNRAERLSTESMVRDLVLSKGMTRESFEDHVAGILVRLVANDGTVLAETDELTRNLPAMDWESFAIRRDPSESDGAGTLADVVASNSD